MNPERWNKVNEVFQEALELEPDEQKEYLDKACANDESLLQQVKTLLAANDQAGNFIAGNAAKDVAHLLTLKNSKTLTGESLGHYEILSILGSGGMGKVYLAKDSKLNRSIAVKTLPNSFSRDSDQIKRFQTEAKAAANLNHPNVATVYSVEETDEHQTFITMEYVEGKPLNKMIPSDGFDQRTFLDLFVSIADALAHAHEKGIVHRDIKPANIMITPPGNPKILDFGLARIDKAKISENASTLSLTKTGQILGTPAYMSPEQAEGKETDHRTDIFSLGVVMYEAITGEKPFKGDNYASIVSNLLGKEPKNITEIKPDVPYLLSRLVMKCLSKEPRYRYQSMNEVRVLLKEVDSALLSGASLSKANQIVTPQTKKGVPIWAFISLCSLLALVSGFAIWKVIQTNKPQNQSIKKLNFVSPTGDNTDLLSARISPDGKNLVMAERSNGASRLYLRPLDSFEAKQIEGSEGAGRPLFSPDGKWLIFETEKKRLKKLAITGGSPVTVCEPCIFPGGADWGNNGMVVFSDGKKLHQVSPNGGEAKELSAPNEEKGEKSHSQPKFLPDGKNVIFTVTAKGKKRTAILSLASKEISYLEGAENASFPVYSPTGHILFSRSKQVYAVAFDLAKLKIVGDPIIVLNGVFGFLSEVQLASNGTLAYLPATTGKGNSLVWLDKNGKDIPALDQKADYYAPRLSPDGNRLAVEIDSTIWVYELESQRRIRLTLESDNSYPVWTPDGKDIVFVRRNNGTEWIIYKKSSDGSGEPKQLFQSKVETIPYSIHPTEPIVAASLSTHSGKGEIITISLEDGKHTSIVKSNDVTDMPRFSPDGKWLAYYTHEADQTQIFVRPWGSENKRFLVTTKNGLYPIWSKTGDEIFYRVGRNFFSTKIKTSPTFQSEEAKHLFKGSYRTNFDLSNDGTKFLAVKSTSGIFPKHLNVISNWTKELEQIIKSEN